MFDSRYESQVELLLQCLPEVMMHPCFALKGGSAINLFVRDMPRLSVDIDLTYVHLKRRADTLTEIESALSAISKGIEKKVPGAKVRGLRIERKVVKLHVSTNSTDIKIEPNLILRGHIQDTRTLSLCPAAEDRYGQATRAVVLSVADLYGGKLCAALDRQHPRDLFDVKLLLDDSGITPEIRRAFVVYLASHNRPMNELLAPRLKNMSDAYHGEFQGMARTEIALEKLEAVQQSLAQELVASLDNDERAFLLSVKQGEPDWDLLGIDNLERFPAIQWKLMNIRKMNPEKHTAALEKLKRILDASP